MKARIFLAALSVLLPCIVVNGDNTSKSSPIDNILDIMKQIGENSNPPSLRQLPEARDLLVRSSIRIVLQLCLDLEFGNPPDKTYKAYIEKLDQTDYNSLPDHKQTEIRRAEKKLLLIRNCHTTLKNEFDALNEKKDSWWPF